MAARSQQQQYHRFRGGDRCDECGARHWYAQDALRYCRNGHRLEGFAAGAADADEDAFGTQGKVSRRRRDDDAEAERRRHAAAKLRGDDARELYLEALQLVLRRQARFLISDQGLPRDLEDLIFALWNLRVRNLPLRRLDGAKGGGAGGGSTSGADSDASGSQMLFSSQSEDGWLSLSSDDSDTASASSWGGDVRRRWKMPRLVDTLTLCYLACVVRRLPVSTADLHRWAQRGEMDFLAALHVIPKSVRERLPAEYLNSLQVRDHIKPGYLQKAALEGSVSFGVIFGLELPPLNHVPLLLRYIKLLLLPIETYSTVTHLAEILEVAYKYPSADARRRAMNNPEVLLISLVMVAAKLAYSLDGIDRPPRDQHDPRALRMDWEAWQRAMAEASSSSTPENHLERGKEYLTTPNDALTMDGTKLDDFMDWFESTWIGDGNPKTAETIRRAFEGQPRTTAPAQTAGDEEARSRCLEAKYKDVDKHVQVRQPQGGEDAGRPHRDLCPVWRSEDDMPQAARVLYRAAAEATATPLTTLLVATAQVERRLQIWCVERERVARGREKGEAPSPRQ